MKDTELKALIERTICEIYLERGTPISTIAVYNRLIVTGIEIPDNVMDRRVKSLQKRRLIKGSPILMMNSEVQRHGAFRIDFVDDKLFYLHNFLRPKK